MSSLKSTFNEYPMMLDPWDYSLFLETDSSAAQGRNL
jgi:hypothetical protein